MTAPSRSHQARQRSAALFACIAVTTAALAGCGGASGSPADSLTIYNGQHPQTTNELVAAFEKATGIQVSVRSADEATLANQIALQGAGSPADVIYTENSPALEFLQSKGLLAPVASAALAQVPARYSAPRRDWVAVSARVSLLIYNPALIKASQLPSSVLQLADPRYRGKLALAAGETDFQPIVTSVLRAYGQAKTLRWLEGIKANATAHLAPDNETVTSEVNRGLVAFGIVNQYYWYRLRAEIGASKMHSRLAYFAPRDPGYVIDVSGAAVLKSSKHQAAAQRFVAFLVSKKGQEIIAHSQSFEYPLRPGVASAATETPFSQLEPDLITIDELGDGSRAIALLQKVGLL